MELVNRCLMLEKECFIEGHYLKLAKTEERANLLSVVNTQWKLFENYVVEIYRYFLEHKNESMFEEINVSFYELVMSGEALLVNDYKMGTKENDECLSIFAKIEEEIFKQAKEMKNEDQNTNIEFFEMMFETERFSPFDNSDQLGFLFSKDIYNEECLKNKYVYMDDRKQDPVYSNAMKFFASAKAIESLIRSGYHNCYFPVANELHAFDLSFLIEGLPYEIKCNNWKEFEIEYDIPEPEKLENIEW